MRLLVSVAVRLIASVYDFKLSINNFDWKTIKGLFYYDKQTLVFETILQVYVQISILPVSF